ncbi:efflux RND transporter periplasmic adaptor subunit [Sphingosinicella sp. YJ22]|uniref:efflux RND transporter periplasmic adaptor subunit n=1 Tax=Sphingosinicella sp. YJ22 TaxID=1104780 RepID=UPI001FAF2C5E|nr:efflux RND transporter periplasmic adaptor subunit [Sphingosinicella sp. YJ22]
MKVMNVETTSWRRDGIEESPVDETVVVVRRRRRRNIIIAVVAVVVLLLAAMFMFGGSAEEPAKAPPKGAQGGQAPVVSVIVPGRQQVGRTITATGSLAAIRDLPVGVPGEGGQVARVLVDAGQWVRAGQVLAVIDRSVQAQEAAQLSAQVGVAQADLRLAQSNLDRAQRLLPRGFVSRADIDRLTATRDAAAARVRVAQAQVAGTRARIQRLDVRAPAAGLVLDRNVEAGQVVGGGSGALFRIAQGGQMELVARLPQDELARLQVGMPAVVTPVGSEQTYQGQIRLVSPIVDPQTRQGEARIAVPYNRELRPGGFAQATLDTGSVTAPLLPESAVQSDAQGSFVLIVGNDNKVVRRNVRIGEVSDRGMSIVEGLNGNERIVLSAGAFLTPGQTVRPERARN